MPPPPPRSPPHRVPPRHRPRPTGRLARLRRWLRVNSIGPRRFFPGLGEATVTAAGVHVRDYPFAPSRAYPEAFVAAGDIRGVCFHGPAYLEVAGDFIVVGREHEPALRDLMAARDVPERASDLIWEFLLEPYLDTEVTPEQDARLLACLAARGVPPGEVAAVRSEVGDVMYAYNFNTRLWEWAGFGLHDVLCAMRAFYPPGDFRDFYWRAIGLEARGRDRVA